MFLEEALSSAFSIKALIKCLIFLLIIWVILSTISFSAMFGSFDKGRTESFCFLALGIYGMTGFTKCHQWSTTYVLLLWIDDGPSWLFPTLGNDVSNSVPSYQKRKPYHLHHRLHLHS